MQGNHVDGLRRGHGMRARQLLRARSERGASAVEFALIVIPLFVLLLGIIQFSLWFWAYQVGSHAAREGARVAAVNPCDTAAIQARVVDRVGGAGTGVSTPPPTKPSPVKVGDTVEVSVSFTPRSIAALFTLPAINKSAEARVENVPAGGC